jgi:DNA-binding transcriptional MocR family regulator
VPYHQKAALMTNLLLYQRIARQLAADIQKGVYQPGERVPSVRKMSAQLNVSHATVLQAYANLEDQGLIRARPQSGYYVHQTPALTAPTPDIARVERPGLVTRSSIIQQVLDESRRDGVFALGAAVPHVDYLPVRALHQQIAKVTRFQSPRAFSYMFSPGYEPLRRQIAIRMRDAGVVVDPSEVVITHGCVDALQMALRTITRPGDLIAAESPTYYGLLQLADLLGLKVIEIPSDPTAGISLEALQLAANQWSIKALMMTSRLSNPLGGVVPEERQKQLLRLVGEFNIQVIEDDIHGELMFDQGRHKALKAYDRLGQVIYCSSFSKTLSPGVRIGWMIAGKHQAEIQRLQTFSTHSACSVTQMAIASYLENGGYDRHLRHIRQEYRKNLTAYQLAVQQHFPAGTQMTRPLGGFILWVSLPGRVNTQELHVRALEQGISIAPGLIFSNTEQFNHCIRLNCGIPWEREAERALMTLGVLATQLCEETGNGAWY